MPDLLPDFVTSTNGRTFARVSAISAERATEMAAHRLLVDCSIFTTPEIELVFSCEVHGTHRRLWHEPDAMWAQTMSEIPLFTNPN